MTWHTAGAAWHQAPAPPLRQKPQEGPPREPGQAAPASHGAAGLDRCAELCPKLHAWHVVWSQDSVVPPEYRTRPLPDPAGTGAAVGPCCDHRLHAIRAVGSGCKESAAPPEPRLARGACVHTAEQAPGVQQAATGRAGVGPLEDIAGAACSGPAAARQGHWHRHCPGSPGWLGLLFLVKVRCCPAAGRQRPFTWYPHGCATRHLSPVLECQAH